jgi:RNA methyltransferase, TrmH family
MNMQVPSLEFSEIGDAVSWLHDHSFTVYLADTDQSINYRQADFGGRTALVVGSERYGISPPWYEQGYRRIGIPMLGAADSLNVSVSASVLLYEARAQKNHW